MVFGSDFGFFFRSELNPKVIRVSSTSSISFRISIISIISTSIRIRISVSISVIPIQLAVLCLQTYRIKLLATKT